MKYYVVREGKKRGIFDSWTEVVPLVQGFSGAKYKSFETLGQATKAFSEGREPYYQNKEKIDWKTSDLPFVKHSIATDAACSKNPGVMEYQGVDLVSGDIIFHKKFPTGTNNIGEFLGIVHGLVYLKENNSDKALYTDSKHAMKWVTEKKCKTNLIKDKESKPIFEVIKRAEDWLKNNTYTTKVLKRNTREWGEIPADFGRK